MSEAHTEKAALSRTCPVSMAAPMPRMCVGSSCMGWSYSQSEYEYARVPFGRKPEGLGWTKTKYTRDGGAIWAKPRPLGGRTGYCAYLNADLIVRRADQVSMNATDMRGVPDKERGNT